MIMIDTNVVIDLLEGTAPWSDWARGALLGALESDAVLASAIVVGELASRFADASGAIEALSDFSIELDGLGPVAAFVAGRAHGAYRAAGGGRERILADFMIGAHALSRDAALLTRDVRRYRTYFPDLTLITPETDHD